ncbi:MAG: cation-transporting P-type ATPase [Clostridia bacterium]|nr:cation-transporting P-type ATPase [Clostridia bacterium]
MIYHSADVEEVISHFEVDPNKGLPTGVADQRFAEHGGNILTKAEKTPLITQIMLQLKNPVNLFLINCAVISLVINLVYMKDKFYSPLLIILILAINLAVSIIHQKQSERTAESLESMNIPKVKVLRDGIVKTVGSTYVVPGDILVLETGDFVCADARLIEAFDFRCNEAFVTGEEITAEKDHNAIHEDITPVEGRSNMVFTGSNVITGRAKAVVTETGMNTEMGKAVTLLKTYNAVDSKLKDKLNSIGKVSGIVLIFFCIIAFTANLLINFRSGGHFAVTLADSLLNSVALLVSVLPEGLPVMAAVAMGVSIKTLLHKGMITKDFAVFNLLPEVNVICSDKTGILTKDKMIAEKIFNRTEVIDANNAFSDSNSINILRLAALCTSQSKEDVDSPMYGDATELAIISAFNQSVSQDERDIYNNYPLLTKLPFDFERKITVTVNMINGIPVAIAKGAPDNLLKASGAEDNELYIKTVNELAAGGMRVIAVAYKELSEIPSNLDYSYIESDMNFAGLIALSDPPQDDSISFIEECDAGNIKTVMITGDHVTTARAVARRLGILKDGSLVISGEELAEMSDEELEENILKYSVFARLLPDQKLRIVTALKKRGMTVAITGDSVNDAQALSKADVGFAPHDKGTDVARGAADIIMNKSSLSTIVEAISTSRSLFCALRKSIVYLLSSNLGELFSILICIFAFGRFPINALQFLIINLVTDTFPALSILSDGVYEHKAIKSFVASDKALFTPRSALVTAVQCIMTTAAAIIGYSITVNAGENTASTVMFTVLIFSQLLNMISVKFEALFFKGRHFRSLGNSLVLAMLTIIVIFLVLTPMGVPFGLAALSFAEFMKATLLSLTVFATGELTKVGFMLYDKLK